MQQQHSTTTTTTTDYCNYQSPITATCVRVCEEFVCLCASCSDYSIVLCWSCSVVVVVVVVECCCWIPYQLALSWAWPLHLLFWPLHLVSWPLHLALVVLSCYQPVQVLHLHTWWWSLAAPCAGGITPSVIGTHTPIVLEQLALCGAWWSVMV